MPPNAFIPPEDTSSSPQEGEASSRDDNSDAAVNVVRQKLSQIYGDEPDALEEMAESREVLKRSKHQQFMYELSSSGKDLATVQTEWHNYYQNLPAHEKHQVWHEFYASRKPHGSHQTFQPMPTPAPTPGTVVTTDVKAAAAPGQARPEQSADPHKLAKHKHEAKSDKKARARAKRRSARLRDSRSPQEIKSVIRDKVSAGGKLEKKHHIQSLLFGLAMGSIVLIIFLFSFFNEVIIAPFIQPSRAEASTPLIISENSVPSSSQPEVIIPKINVQIPVDYTQTTTNDKQIENALDSAVVHYPTTVKPGENGNTALFGHSSNNIFNKGKYKFAFVLLRTLEEGDTFYLTYNGKTYVYKVFSKKIVDPTEVGVLGPVPGKQATATLITCDPPGTSLKRLIVIGEQVSPSPTGNTQGSEQSGGGSAIQTSESLPGNGQTLWGRLMSTALGKGIVIAIIAAAFIVTIRWVTKPQRLAAAAS